MVYQVGYWVDVDSMSFDETEQTSTFQAMPIGEYEHPIYGKINITPEKVANIVKNVNDNVRGTELDIDYEHKAKSGEAAGWVKKASQAADGSLQLTVQWTKDAWTKLKEKAYRYFSPEFTDEWTHPKTKTVHKDVLFGGGLTNRPFLKDILPLNMSELFAEQEERNTGMDPKKRRKLLGLPEDATDEQCEAAEDARLAELDKPADENKETEDKKEIEPVAASEILAAVKKLGETDPAVKQLADLVAGLAETVQTQGAALQLAETQLTVQKLAEPQNGRMLSAGAQKQLTELLISPTPDGVKKFTEGLLKDGLVPTGETDSHSGNGFAGDAIKQFTEKVDALIKIASEDPDLFDAYQEASYAFKNGN
jgi:phage I-like protein